MRVDPALGRLCAPDLPREPPVTLVVAAHSDDETLGAGSFVARVARRCSVLHVTDGAPSDPRFIPRSHAGKTRAEYAEDRRAESLRALGIAGLDGAQVLGLGLRDQEATVHLAEATRRLGAILLVLSPEFIIGHAYEGGHPDHDAAAFIVHAAARALRALGLPPPSLVEMTSYHDRGGRTVRGKFLPVPGAGEIAIALGADEQARKRAMLGAYASQRDVIAPFGTDVERFRVAPEYDFAHPPHPGALHYERMGFPMSGAAWRVFAGAAMAKLGLDAEPL
jgi:N-acetylglucosamine malate deacetylase 2